MSPDPLRVLVLDDEPRFRAFLEEVVTSLGCEALPAGSAVEARRHAAATPPDILLLDLNLPVTDGVTYLEEFRAGFPAAPVIIITGFGDLASAQAAIRFGVLEFLTKPCDLGELERVIDRARRRIAETRARDAAEARQPGVSAGANAGIQLRPLAQLERDAIFAGLRETGGNRSETARRLGISRRALYNKLALYERDGETPTMNKRVQ